MGIFGNRKEESKGRGGAGKAGQHKDPVCGMLVVEEEAVGPVAYRGEAYWFCGEGCEGTFRQRSASGQERGQEVAR